MFTALALLALTPAADPFAFKDGDRIVWVGGTPVEREQRYGHWEAALHAAHPGLTLTVRNLGWSGDTVYGDARAGFDDASKGFERLVSLTLELKPTVVFVGYGSNEAFDGPAGLPRFEKGLAKLLDSLKPANARTVLFAPIPFESGPAAERNTDVKAYAGVVKATAAKRGHRFADIGATMTDVRTPRTDNGLHFTDDGYRGTRDDFLRALGIPAPTRTASEPLRRAVVAKNELFFHRWRPQNETYLFGFRKHEQGKNAKEIVEFDPLVAKAEAAIAAAR